MTSLRFASDGDEPHQNCHSTQLTELIYSQLQAVVCKLSKLIPCFKGAEDDDEHVDSTHV